MRKTLLTIIFLLSISPSVYAAAPVIFYTDITSGPNTGCENNHGAYLTIFGKNFGSDINVITVTVGGGAVYQKVELKTSYGRTDVQQLSVQLGSSVVTGAIKITVGGVDSNTDQTFTVRSGQCYFVSLTGNSSTGVVNDSAHPYRNPNDLIRGANGSLAAGDIIYVRGGTWDLTNSTNGSSIGSWIRPLSIFGTPSAPIAVLGYPGEIALIQSGASYGMVYQEGYGVSAHDFIIGNFRDQAMAAAPGMIIIGPSADPTAACADAAGTTEQATNIKIVNIEGFGNDQYGMGQQNEVPIVISYSHHSKIYGVSYHNTAPGAQTGTYVVYSQTRQDDTDIGWCDFHHLPMARRGIMLNEDCTSSQGNYNCCDNSYNWITNVKIHDTIMHDIGSSMYVCLSDSIGDVYIYNNILYSVVDNGGAYDVLIAVRGNPSGHPVSTNARIYNNTVYASPAGGTQSLVMLGYGNYTNYVNATIENNIFYATSSSDHYISFDSGSNQTSSTVTSDYNIFYGSNNSPLSWEGVHSNVVNPLFSNAGTADFTLQSGSPAKDAGTSAVSAYVTQDFNGVSRPQGSAYDIGAFEYASGGSPVNGACGSNKTGTFSSLTSGDGNNCSAGSVSSFLTGQSPHYWTWTCTGSGGGSNDMSCYADQSSVVNGACGSASGQSFSSLNSGSSNLCSAGTVASFSGSGPWTWGCNGSGGGTSTGATSCSASYSANPSPPTSFKVGIGNKNFKPDVLSTRYIYLH